MALLAGLPITTAGTTVNRWCGSSLEALHIAAHAIRAGDKDVQLVAGVEHMTHLPMETGFNPHPALYARVGQAAFHMGLTAEFLANSSRSVAPRKTNGLCEVISMPWLPMNKVPLTTK